MLSGAALLPAHEFEPRNELSLLLLGGEAAIHNFRKRSRVVRSGDCSRRLRRVAIIDFSYLEVQFSKKYVFNWQKCTIY